MRKKLTMLGLCAMATITIVACSSPNKDVQTIEPTNKVTNESTSEETTPSVTPSEEVTPSVTPSEEPTPSPTPSEEPTPSPTPNESEDEGEKKEPQDGSNDDDKSSSKEEASSSSKEENSESKTENSTSKEETSSSTKEPSSSSKEDTSTSKEPTTTPTQTLTTTPTVPENSSSSSNVVVVPPVEDDPIPTPTPNPTPTPTPSTPSGWNGNYDSPLSDGFDHIKIPTRNDFYSEGLTNNDGAFDFNGSDWSNAWWDAYQDFLVANGSPVDENGNVYGAFYAIHDGFNDGYQYLYYGFSQGATNGWGPIALLNSQQHNTIRDDSNYNGSYLLEITGDAYAPMDKQSQNDYRAATTMLLSWVCPNPSQVEKVIYDSIDENCTNSILVNHVVQNGFGSWMQVGEVDVCVYYANDDGIGIAIRNHQ